MKNIEKHKILKSLLATRRVYDEYHLAVLDGNDVISAQVSDHHPVVYQTSLCFNIMMRCATRRGGYNNGFGIEETDQQYTVRLSKVAAVIAEIVFRNPGIIEIGICEGPVRKEDLDHFLKSLTKFPWMKALVAKGFYQPQVKHKADWGLLLLVDSHFQVKKVKNEIKQTQLSDKLANRFQTWELSKGKQKQYFSLLHLPFSADEHKTSKSALSVQGKAYCDFIALLLVKYADQFSVICGDFNFNPSFVEYYSCNTIPTNNSVLWEKEDQRSTTVDGIILTKHAKRMSYKMTIQASLFMPSFEKKKDQENIVNNCLGSVIKT